MRLDQTIDIFRQYRLRSVDMDQKNLTRTKILSLDVGDVMKNKRETLVEEVNLLNDRIRDLRRRGKDCSAEMDQLIRLIMELDNLEQDKEIREYDEDGS